MNFKQLQTEAHKIARDKGFWSQKCSHCEETGRVGHYECPYCNGKGLVPIKRNLSELLMLIVSELGEACEALRKHQIQEIFDGWRKDTFEDELADAIIRIMDLSESEGIDLEWQIINKLEYNKTREQKHGKLF